jgi:hypothetical protein
LRRVSKYVLYNSTSGQEEREEDRVTQGTLADGYAEVRV